MSDAAHESRFGSFWDSDVDREGGRDGCERLC